MKAKIHQITFLFCIFLLAVSCEEDSSTQPLPEGRYPLEIAAVTLGVEGGEAQFWTRVAETADGRGSEFRPGDAIAVSMNGEVATYTYDGSKWTSGQPLYWQSAGQTAEVTAWHPATEAPIDFTHQDQGLAYLLKADAATATAGQPVSLNFRHQLAKVRVQLAGSKAKDVTAVTVRSYPSSTHTQGALDAQDRTLTPQYVPMLQAEYGGQKCWEANLRPGTLQAGDSFRVASEGGERVQATLADDVRISAGQLYTITINVNTAMPEGTQEITDATGNIDGEGTYVVRGSDRTTPINITGGSPTIYLDEATVAVGSGNAINITGGNPTIYVVGEDNTIYSGNGAGIYVAEGSTVTIKGNKESDVLKVTGNGGGSGIGGYIRDGYPYDAIPCGNIVIENITLYAYSSPSAIDDLSPGIGGASGGACGTITIHYATVHAYGNITHDGNITSSGIGNGISSASETSQIPITNIYNSKIHAHRGVPGNNADYIGGSSYRNGVAGDGASTINLGGGKCTGSTVYCYTGETLDKTVEYDDQGTGTEITQ